MQALNYLTMSIIHLTLILDISDLGSLIRLIKIVWTQSEKLALKIQIMKILSDE